MAQSMVHEGVAMVHEGVAPILPPDATTPLTADECIEDNEEDGINRCFAAEEQSKASVAKESSKYFSRTVANRVRTLLSGSSGGFQVGVGTAGSFNTGVSAGENASPAHLDNLSFDTSYSRTRSKGMFNIDSVYALMMTDKVVNPQRVVGFGLGVERSRERLAPNNSKVKSEGVSLTGYVAQIINEHFIFIPQASFTYLFRETEQSGQRDDSNAWRAFASLGMLGQQRFEQVELSSFGQFVYTYEDPNGSAERLYVGQVHLSGEIGFMPEEMVKPFLGVSADYDLIRSISSDEQFGYGASAGVRSTLESGSLVTAVISHSWRGSHENTLDANVFLKIFF